jgi:hypothetical protein
MIGRIKRLYDEVKLYGTSCRVETSIKRQQVITEIERILARSATFLDKSKIVPKHSNLYLANHFLACLLAYGVRRFFSSYVNLLLLLYSAFFTPVQITFFDELSVPGIVIDALIDFFFFLGVLVNLNSPFLHDETN